MPDAEARPPMQPPPNPPAPDSPPEKPTARDLIHEVNNFLAVCMTHGEMALETDTAEAMRDALGEILFASRRMAASVEETRRAL